MSQTDAGGLEQVAVGPLEPSIPPADAARRLSRILGILASLTLVIAVAVNMLLVPDAKVATPGPATGEAGVPGVPGAELSADFAKPAVHFLPERVLAYETITRQAIPGRGESAAEAVFKTLNMNFEAMVAVVNYARVEQFSSPAQAQARLDELLKPYSAKRKSIMLNGVTPVEVGEAPNGGAFVYGWLRGNVVTIVKTSFQDAVPVERRTILQTQCDQVADAVDVYQRTGREGVSK